METTNSLLRKSSRVVSKTLTNDYVVAFVALLGIAYASTFVPRMPSRVASALDNIVVKFIILFVIAYAVVRKADVALIASLAVLALVLGLQIYLPEKPVPAKPVESSHLEKMSPGFQNQLESRQADVRIDDKGNFMEKEPLSQQWTAQQQQVTGQQLDWPGFEMSDSDSMASSLGPIVPHNQADNEAPAEGEVVGVATTNTSMHASL